MLLNIFDTDYTDAHGFDDLIRVNPCLSASDSLLLYNIIIQTIPRAGKPRFVVTP